MNHAAIWIRRVLTTGLTIIAFANSYAHTVQWFKDHGQSAQAGWLAAIPEVGVILVVLTLAAGGLSKPVQWLIGSIGIGSLGITFTSNISGASAGAMGLIAALVAPTFAVLGFGLEMVSLNHELEPVRADSPAGDEPVQDEPVIVVQVQDQPKVQPEREPVQDQPKKAQRRPAQKTTGGLLDNGVLWAQGEMDRLNEWPSVTEIMAQFPEMSRSTAKRVRAANPVGTDGTAKTKESVNA
jgi:hypothetical protein